MADYTYQIADAELGQLETEIGAAGVPGLSYTCFQAPISPATLGELMVTTDAALSAGDETTLDGAVAAHVPAESMADRLNVLD